MQSSLNCLCAQKREKKGEKRAEIEKERVNDKRREESGRKSATSNSISNSSGENVGLHKSAYYVFAVSFQMHITISLALCVYCTLYNVHMYVLLCTMHIIEQNQRK